MKRMRSLGAVIAGAVAGGAMALLLGHGGCGPRLNVSARMPGQGWGIVVGGPGNLDVGEAVNRAESSLPGTGGVVRILPGAYSFRTTIVLRPHVYLVGYGAVLHYVGAGDAVRVPASVAAPYLTGGLLGFELTGTGRARAVGVHQMGTVGVIYNDLVVWGFTRGVGIWLDNQNSSFNERTSFERVSVGDCRTGVLLSNSGGTDSFGYTHFTLTHLQVGPGQVGLRLSGPRVRLYNADLSLDFSEFVGGWGAPAKAMVVEKGAVVEDCFFMIFGENAAGGSGGLGLVVGPGSAVRGWGAIRWSNLRDKIARSADYSVGTALSPPGAVPPGM